MANQRIKANLIPSCDIYPVIHLAQYDVSDGTGKQVEIELYYGTDKFTIPSGSSITFRGTKRDKTGYSYEITKFTDNVVTVDVKPQMTVLSGTHFAELRISKGNTISNTIKFVMKIDSSALADDTKVSETDLSVIEKALQASDAAIQAKAEVEQLKESVEASEKNAKQSETNASQSATNAQESAESASTSAATASTKATEASTSATKAKESETNAQSSAESAIQTKAEVEQLKKETVEQTKTLTDSAKQEISTVKDATVSEVTRLKTDTISDITSIKDRAVEEVTVIKDDAKAEADKAKQSETNAKQSETNASNSAKEAKESADSVANVVSDVSKLKEDVSENGTTLTDIKKKMSDSNSNDGFLLCDLNGNIVGHIASFEVWNNEPYNKKYGWGGHPYGKGKLPPYSKIVGVLEADLLSVRGGKGRWNKDDTGNFKHGGHLFEGWNAEEDARLTFGIGTKNKDISWIQTFHAATQEGTDSGAYYCVTKVGSDTDNQGMNFMPSITQSRSLFSLKVGNNLAPNSNHIQKLVETGELVDWEYNKTDMVPYGTMYFDYDKDKVRVYTRTGGWKYLKFEEEV